MGPWLHFALIVQQVQAFKPDVGSREPRPSSQDRSGEGTVYALDQASAAGCQIRLERRFWR